MYVWEKGAKKAVLLAMDLLGQVLGFEGPTSRTAHSWRRLLERLSERGVDPGHGLKYVVADGDTSIRQAVEWRRRIKTTDGFKSHMAAKNLLAVLIQWHNWWRDNHSASRRMHRATQP